MIVANYKLIDTGIDKEAVWSTWWVSRIAGAVFIGDPMKWERVQVSLMHASGNKKSGAIIEEEDGKFKRETGVCLGQNIILYISIVQYVL